MDILYNPVRLCFSLKHILQQPLFLMSGSTRRHSKTASSSSWHFPILLSIVFPITLASVLFRLEPFQPVHYPAGAISGQVLTAPARNSQMQRGSETVGEGHVAAPEDLVFDRTGGAVYTGCSDGWIKRVTVNDSAVESWVNTGGRPLGLALDRTGGELIVADAYKGLLRVSKQGEIELLTDEADGLKFKITDGVDVAEDGTIYFTDASYKYNLKDFVFDVLEGKPNGRLLSYDPSTKHTALLASNLFFANGVAVSPDQQFVVFCETMLRKCKKYYIEGPKKGSIEIFIEDLPGMPDNIHYDGEGQYWIGLASAPTYSWDLVLRYPILRKVAAIITKYVGRPHWEKNGGVIAVDLEGKPIAHYFDPQLSMVTSVIKIGHHIYCGSLHLPFILRLDLNQYPALPTI